MGEHLVFEMGHDTMEPARPGVEVLDANSSSG